LINENESHSIEMAVMEGTKLIYQYCIELFAPVN